uniref:Copia protein n=1 Tax=Tanacetum cinerariifolium TaxID=118510 RepID=A0A6L2JYX7_TANCI|nr:copia protein [Tanacetum cinerariifolium]
MTSLFADSHYMVAILEKSDAAGGFEQIIDFLSGSYIHHALTVNLHVYISCIKQFWNTPMVKRSGDVTRLQALVDKKRIVITKELSTKLTFYKAFFSTQWKFFIHTILHSLSAKRTSWNEFSSAMASALICLSSDDDVQEHAEEEVATNVVPPTPTSPSPSSPVLDTCSALVLRVEGLENANAAQQLEIVKLKARVKKLERLNKVKSSKLRRLKKVGTSQRVESSDDVENVFNQGRISVDIETDEGIELVVNQEKDAEVEGRHADKQAEIYNIDLDHSSMVLSMQEDTKVQESVEVVTTAKLITEVITAAATQVVAASAPIPVAKPKTLKIAAAPAVSTRIRKGVVIRNPEEELHTDTLDETPTMKDKGRGILIEDLKPMKKKDQVEMDAVYAKKLQEELNKEHEKAYKNIDWNAAFDHVQSKETQYIKRYHGFKKKPQSESKARKNMISYLKNTKGYKMEFFKGKIEEMEKEDEEIIKSINETPTQKAAKRRKLSEEAQEADDLKKRLEIVQDEDDDVFVEAIPLAQKFPVVDYQVVVIDNKPKYKIIRADDTHQFYISFTTLLKNFDREDLETLWRIVKDRFSIKKPTNFLDEHLLLTLKTMFGELDEHDPIWRNQKSVHGLELVKRWKLLTSYGVHMIILSTVQLFLLVERRTPACTNAFEDHTYESFSPFKNEFSLPHVPIMTPINDTGIFGNAYDDEAIEEEVDMNNVVSSYIILDAPLTKFHKDHPKDQIGCLGHTQEEGIDYDEVFAPVARIEATRLILAYASFKDFVVYKMDVKSDFLYRKIEEEVYVYQPPGFEDPYFPDKVYKVKKALYGLHQAPRAWYETLSTYLIDNRFHRGQIDKTLFIKRHKDDILLVQVYVDDIIFGSTKKELSAEFEKLMHDKLQMSSMGELSFFFGLQVQQKCNTPKIGRSGIRV